MPSGVHTKAQFPAFEVSENYEEYLKQLDESAAQKVVVSDKDDVPDRAETEQDSSSELTLEQKIDAVLSCVGSQNALREILYKILLYCREQRDFSEVEDFVSSQDEFVYSHIIQTPYTLIDMLVRADGLNKIPIDAAGTVVTQERCEGLSEEEAQDLIAEYKLNTTEAGVAVTSLMDPDRRLKAQIALHPHRSDTFYALLNFCTEPRKFPEIQQFFEDTPGLALDKVQIHHTLSPDYYVDKLKNAGMLVWQGAWIATDAGLKALEEHQSDIDKPLDE